MFGLVLVGLSKQKGEEKPKEIFSAPIQSSHHSSVVLYAFSFYHEKLHLQFPIFHIYCDASHNSNL